MAKNITEKINQPPTLVYKRRGIKVKDSYSGLKIKVLPEDIDGAICRDHQKCVIAKAIKRGLKAKWVDVGCNVVLVGIKDNLARRYILSSVARNQVQYFDTHDGKFAPCNVQLLPPSISKRLAYLKKGKFKWGSRGSRILKKRKPTR